MIEAGEYEVQSYQTFAGISREIPGIVRCFSAEYSAEANNYHVLLENISDTHAIALHRDEVIKGVMPPQTRLEEVLDCLAKFHAFWWEHPKLGEGVLARHFWFKDAESAKLLFEKRNRELDLFVDNVGANFSPDLIVLYREVLAKFPDMYERYIAERLNKLEKVTLVHGDCYLNQFFCPKESRKYPTYLLDMQSLSAYFPADDLTHIIAAFWTGEQRQSKKANEESLLRFYLERLQSYGVKNYTWADLQQDYKLAIIYLLFEAIWNQTDGSSEAYWRKKLNCLTEAFLEH
jgi:Ecdysteroid kinase-like family